MSVPDLCFLRLFAILGEPNTIIDHSAPAAYVDPDLDLDLCRFKLRARTNRQTHTQCHKQTDNTKYIISLDNNQECARNIMPWPGPLGPIKVHVHFSPKEMQVQSVHFPWCPWDIDPDNINYRVIIHCHKLLAVSVCCAIPSRH